MDSTNWRSQLTRESREEVIKRITEILEVRMSQMNQKSNRNDIIKIAVRFEEKIFQEAADKEDYLRKISSRMTALEKNNQGTAENAFAARRPSGANSVDSGSFLQQQQSNQGHTNGGGMVAPNVLQAPSNMVPLIAGASTATQSSLTNAPTQSSLVPNSNEMLANTHKRLQQLQGLHHHQQQQKITQQQLQANFMLQHQQQPSLLQQQNPSTQLNQQQQQQWQQQQKWQQHQPQSSLSIESSSSQTQPQASLLMQQQQPSLQSQMLQMEAGGVGDHSAVSRPDSIGVNEEQDLVFAKLQLLKEKYFQLLKESYLNLAAKCNQPLPNEQLAKVKQLKDHVQRVLPYLTLTKEKMPKELNCKRFETVERHIVGLAETFKRNRLSQQQALQDQQNAQLKQQQQAQLQQEHLVKGGDMASSAQSVSQSQHSEKQMQHMAGQPLATVLKPNEVLSGQVQMNSSLQRGASRLGMSNSNNLGTDMPTKSIGMLQSVVGNALSQSFVQSRLLKEQEQAAMHMQKNRGDSIQQGLNSKPELKPKQVELQQALLQHQSLKQRPNLLQHSPVLRDAPHHTVDNVPKLSEASPNLQHGVKVETPPTQSSTLMRIPTPVLQSLNSPQEVESRCNKGAVLASLAARARGDGIETGAGYGPSQEISASPYGCGMSPMLNQTMPLQDVSQHAPVSTSTCREPPLEQLTNKIETISAEALNSAVNDIVSLVNFSEMLSSAAPGIGSNAGIGEDLALTTRTVLHASSSVERSKITTKKARIFNSVAEISLLESGQIVSGSCEASSGKASKRHKIEVCPALKLEILHANQQLIETHLEIDERATEEIVAGGGSGVVVLCLYVGSALHTRGSSCSKVYSEVFLPPLRFLVSSNYPETSPAVHPQPLPFNNSSIVLAAREEFMEAARKLECPVSLASMAKAWDACARNAVKKMASSIGGGSFSSAMGVWQSCKMS